MAQNGHPSRADECPLLAGVKRTLRQPSLRFAQAQCAQTRLE